MKTIRIKHKQKKARESFFADFWEGRYGKFLWLPFFLIWKFRETLQ